MKTTRPVTIAIATALAALTLTACSGGSDIVDVTPAPVASETATPEVTETETETPEAAETTTPEVTETETITATVPVKMDVIIPWTPASEDSIVTFSFTEGEDLVSLEPVDGQGLYLINKDSYEGVPLAVIGEGVIKGRISVVDPEDILATTDEGVDFELTVTGQ